MNAIHERGFTLIKFLIAIVIFASLIAMAAFSFRYYAGIVKKIVAPYPQKAMRLSELRDVIDSAFYYVGEKVNSLQQREEFFVVFDGRRKEMIFVSAEPLFINSGVVLCRIYMDTKKRELILEESPIYDKKVNYKDPSFLKNDKKVVLLENVKDVDFYYYIDGDRVKEVENRMPNMVEVVITQLGKDGRQSTLTLYFRIKSDFRNKVYLTKAFYASSRE